MGCKLKNIIIAIVLVFSCSLPLSVASVAMAEDLGPETLATKSFEIYFSINYRLKSQSVDLKLYDRAMSRTKTDFGEILRDNPQIDPAIIAPFTYFTKIENLPKDVIYRTDEFSQLKALSTHENWRTQYTALWLQGILFLRRNDITAGQEVLTSALASIPSDDKSKTVDNALFDIYDLMHVAMTMDRYKEQSLEVIDDLLFYSNKTKRKIDPYTLAHNLAVIYNFEGDRKKALSIINTTQPYLDKASDKQLLLYKFSLGRFQVANEDFKDGAETLRQALELNPPPHIKAYTLVNLAKALNSSENITELTDIIEQIEALESQELNQDISQALTGLKARRYELMGNPAKALNNYKGWYEYQLQTNRKAQTASRLESTEKLERAQAITSLRLQNEIESGKLKDEIIEKEKALVRRKTYLLLAASFLALLAFLMVIREKVNNQRLKLSRDKALKGEKAKSEFLQTLSHEFRTPLNAIIPIADLIKDSTQSKEHKAFAGLISANGNSLLHMIDNILKITKGREETTLIVDDINPAQLITNMVNFFEDPTGRKPDIQVRFGTPVIDSFPTNALAFKSIITNLLSNAVKFAPEGTIRISMTRDPHQSGGLHVTIRDTGIGMNPDHLAEYQKPFATADATIKRQFEGVGIGLAVVNLCVEQCGARADCTTGLGQGTTWDLYFPPLELTPLSTNYKPTKLPDPEQKEAA